MPVRSATDHPRRRWRWAAGAWGGLVTVLLLTPGGAEGPLAAWAAGWVPGGSPDKWVHVALFAALALLLRKAALGPRPDLAAVAVGALWGAATELAQLQVPGRRGDALDFAADVVGVLVAVAVARGFSALRRRSR